MKLAMVFSSGGPMGASHLGVLKRLKEEGIKPDVLAGSSAGSIISGLYASGMEIDAMIDTVLEKNFPKLFSDYSLFGQESAGFGAIRGNNFLNFLRDKSANMKFKDAKIPIAFNAVDSFTGKQVTLRNGNIAEAMRASSSIPIMFRPFKMNERYLIDGSVADPMPVHLAKKLGADFTIGISFTRGHTEKADTKSDYTFEDLKHITLKKLDNTVLKSLKFLLELPFMGKILNFFHLDDRTIKHYVNMHNSGIENKSKKLADAFIETDLSNADAHNIESLIQKGYEDSGGVVDEIHRKIEAHKMAV